MKFKRFIGLILLFSLILSIGITASARTPYANYYIQEKEKTAKPIPAAYETSTVIDFLSTETGKLKNPEDMFIDLLQIDLQAYRSAFLPQRYTASQPWCFPRRSESH